MRLVIIIIGLMAVLAACETTPTGDADEQDPTETALRSRADILVLALNEAIWTDAHRLTSREFQEACDVEPFITAMVERAGLISYNPGQRWMVEEVSVDETQATALLGVRDRNRELVGDPEPAPFVLQEGQWRWDPDPETHC